MYEEGDKEVHSIVRNQQIEVFYEVAIHGLVRSWNTAIEWEGDYVVKKGILYAKTMQTTQYKKHYHNGLWKS